MQCAQGPLAIVDPASPGLRWSSIVTEDSLLALEPEWTDLFVQSGCQNVFLTFDWMWEWWSEFGRRDRLFVIVVRTFAGSLVGVAPFYVSSSLLGRVGPRGLRFLASSFVGSDQLDLLVRPGFEEPVADSVAQAVAAYRREWDYIELRDTSGMSRALGRLRAQLGMRERVVQSTRCPYVQLPDSFECYLAGLSAHVSRNFRRYWRALEKQGPVEVVSFTDARAVSSGFAEVVRLHRLRFESKAQNSAFLNEDVQRFHAAVLPRLAAHGWVRICLLKVRGRAVAALYGFSTGRRCQSYQSGIDPSWSRFSVGMLMLGISIRQAILTGHVEYDFLRGEEQYKYHWGNLIREQRTVWLFDNRVSSLSRLVVTVLREQLGRLKRSLASLWLPTRPMED